MTPLITGRDAPTAVHPSNDRPLPSVPGGNEAQTANSATVDGLIVTPLSFKASELPLSSAVRSAIDGLVHTFKKKGGYDSIRKQAWEKFEASGYEEQVTKSILEVADKEVENNAAQLLSIDRRKAAALIDGAVERSGVYQKTEAVIEALLSLNEIETRIRDIRRAEIGDEAATEEQTRGARTDYEYAVETAARRAERERVRKELREAEERTLRLEREIRENEEAKRREEERVAREVRHKEEREKEERRLKERDERRRQREQERERERDIRDRERGRERDRDRTKRDRDRDRSRDWSPDRSRDRSRNRSRDHRPRDRDRDSRTLGRHSRTETPREKPEELKKQLSREELQRLEELAMQDLLRESKTSETAKQPELEVDETLAPPPRKSMPVSAIQPIKRTSSIFENKKQQPQQHHHQQQQQTQPAVVAPSILPEASLKQPGVSGANVTREISKLVSGASLPENGTGQNATLVPEKPVSLDNATVSTAGDATPIGIVGKATPGPLDVSDPVGKVRHPMVSAAANRGREASRNSGALEHVRSQRSASRSRRDRDHDERSRSRARRREYRDNRSRSPRRKRDTDEKEGSRRPAERRSHSKDAGDRDSRMRSRSPSRRRRDYRDRSRSPLRTRTRDRDRDQRRGRSRTRSKSRSPSAKRRARDGKPVHSPSGRGSRSRRRSRSRSRSRSAVAGSSTVATRPPILFDKEELEAWKQSEVKKREQEAKAYLAAQREAREKGLPIPGVDDKRSTGDRSPEVKRKYEPDEIDRYVPKERRHIDRAVSGTSRVGDRIDRAMSSRDYRERRGGSRSRSRSPRRDYRDRDRDRDRDRGRDRDWDRDRRSRRERSRSRDRDRDRDRDRYRDRDQDRDRDRDRDRYRDRDRERTRDRDRDSHRSRSRSRRRRSRSHGRV